MMTFTRYALKTFMWNFFLLWISFTSLLQIVDLLNNSDEVLDRHPRDVGAVVEYAIWRLPELAVFLIPFSVLMAALLSLAKFERSNETLALKSAGAPYYQILLAFLPAVGIVAVLHFTLTDQIVPRAINHLMERDLYVDKKSKNDDEEDQRVWVQDGDTSSRSVRSRNRGPSCSTCGSIERDDLGNITHQRFVRHATFDIHTRKWTLEKIEDTKVIPDKPTEVVDPRDRDLGHQARPAGILRADRAAAGDDHQAAMELRDVGADRRSPDLLLRDLAAETRRAARQFDPDDPAGGTGRAQLRPPRQGRRLGHGDRLRPRLPLFHHRGPGAVAGRKRRCPALLRSLAAGPAVRQYRRALADTSRRLLTSMFVVWIDAAHGAGERVFGLTLLERHLKALKHRKVQPGEVVIDLGAGETPEPPEAGRRWPFPVRVVRNGGTIAQRLGKSAVGGRVLALDTHTLIDARLYDFVTAQSRDLAVQDGDAVAAWIADPAALDADARDLRAAVPPSLPRLTQAEFPGFIRNLRRTLPFYLFRVTNAGERAKVERFLFWSNYKGSTDFFTKYVYPPLVWVMVRPLARAHVHPNWVTIISIVLTFAAVPLFGAGYFLAGFLCAYGMSVLDSVDGKLARLTFTDSKLGNVLDHGLDLVHPPFWYCAWAYGLSHGRRLVAGVPGLAADAGALCDRPADPEGLPDPLRPRAAHARPDGRVRAHFHLPPQHQLTFIYSWLRGGTGDRDDLPDRVLAGRHLRLSRRPDGLDPGL